MTYVNCFYSLLFFFLTKKGGGVVYIFLLLKFVEPGGPEPRVQAQGQAAKPTSKRNKKKKVNVQENIMKEPKQK